MINPLPDNKNFRLVQIETNCRQNFEVHLKLKKKVPYRVENIVRKGEIACYKQFLLFSHNVFHSYISLVCQNAALHGNGLTQL